MAHTATRVRDTLGLDPATESLLIINEMTYGPFVECQDLLVGVASSGLHEKIAEKNPPQCYASSQKRALEPTAS